MSKEYRPLIIPKTVERIKQLKYASNYNVHNQPFQDYPESGKNMKSLLLKQPELILILLAFLAGYTPPFYVNPVFAVIIAIVIIQLIIKNKYLGLALGILYFVVNLYFMGALLAEFNEFAEFNLAAKKLIGVGVAIWLLNNVMAITMIYKYSNLKQNRQPGPELSNPNSNRNIDDYMKID